MAVKKMKQAHGMNTILTPEQQWEIVKKFDGEKNPFGGKSKDEIEDEIRGMSLDSLQKYAIQLEIIPTNSRNILKTKIMKKYDSYSKGLNRSPIAISNSFSKTSKAKQKRLQENLKSFMI